MHLKHTVWVLVQSEKGKQGFQEPKKQEESFRGRINVSLKVSLVSVGSRQETQRPRDMPEHETVKASQGKADSQVLRVLV